MTSTAVPRSTARLRRIDLRVVIGLALLLAGVLGTVAVVQRAGQRVPVLVVAREVPAVLAEVAQVSRRVGLLAGLARPDAAGLLHRHAVHALLAAVRRIEGLDLVVIDPGRLLPGSVAAAVLEAAAVRVLAVRADLPGALAAQRALGCTRHGSMLVPVAVGVQRPADAVELADALGRPWPGWSRPTRSGCGGPSRAASLRPAVGSGVPTARWLQLHPTGGRATRSRTRGRQRRMVLGSVGLGAPATAACLGWAPAT
jgi:hypothetical protein